MKWKYKVGDRGTYITTGQGSVERAVTIVAFNPAGEPLPDEYVERMKRNTLALSKIDRYVIETPRLTKKGAPSSLGTVDVMCPSRDTFDNHFTLAE
jgi:hypothetical protein